MKKYKIAFQMTQSMFCSLPFSGKEWDETCRPYMLIFLPMIGLEIGFLWVLIDWLTNYFAIPALIRGLILCGWPYVVTGFLHLDGFMDVVDAVCSWRPLERRREILKDSHVGSFAVVWCVFLLLAGFSVFSSMPGHAEMGVLLFVPVVSRCRGLHSADDNLFHSFGNLAFIPTITIRIFHIYPHFFERRGISPKTCSEASTICLPIRIGSEIKLLGLSCRTCGNCHYCKARKNSHKNQESD